MGGVYWTVFIHVFLTSILALWWPNIWLKMEFPEFKKTQKNLMAQLIWYPCGSGIYHSLDPYSFSCSCWQLQLCGVLLFAWKGGFQTFFTPWPSSGQNNAGIILKTRVSRRFTTCVAPATTAKYTAQNISGNSDDFSALCTQGKFHGHSLLMLDELVSMITQ